MKKVLFAAIVLLLVLAVVSCGNNETPPEQTGEQTTNDIPMVAPEDGILRVDPAKFYKVAVFELPDDFRQAAVDHMKKQASIEWVCSKTFSVSEKWAYWGIDLTFKKGQTYHGIPYANTYACYTEFQNVLVNGTYTNESTTWYDVHGNQCNSSIMNALQQFDPNIAGVSTVWMPSYTEFQAKILGDYKAAFGTKRTYDIIEANGKDIIVDAYTKLKKGDIILTKDDVRDVTHLRMVSEDPVITYTRNGSINLHASYIKTVEQTNSFDNQRTDGVKTTWWIDHKYSFNELYDTNYIPITLKIYSKDKSECEVPYITLDKPLDGSTLTENTINSTVTSNFPIRYVSMEIFDENGTLVHTKMINKMADIRKIPLRPYSFSAFKDLSAGNYSLKLTAAISAGEAVLQTVNFTVK